MWSKVCNVFQKDYKYMLNSMLGYRNLTDCSKIEDIYLFTNNKCNNNGDSTLLVLRKAR